MRRASVLLAVALVVALPLAALAAEPFTATLTGDAETPPVETDATGSANVTISDDGTSIDFEVTFEGLSGDGTATMAHIHFGPNQNEPGPPIIWFTEVGVTDGSNSSPLSGTATEDDFTPNADAGPQTWDEALEAIRAGDTYVNVHTTTNPGGEIRGQLMEIPDTAIEAAPAASLAAPLALVVLAAALAFLVTLRRFAVRRV